MITSSRTLVVPAVASALVASLAVLTAAAASPGAPELLSKRFEFREGVALEIRATANSGLRLDSVEFKLPARSGDRLIRTAGVMTATVSVSNTGEDSLKAGIAIALFDDEGRLLGVASGGNKLSAVRAGRQKRFSLVFEGVYAEAHRATTFQISLETRP